MMIRKFFGMVCLVFLSGFAVGQKIDSLKRLLSGGTVVENIDILYELGYEYIDVDNEIAGRYALQGYNSAKELKDTIRVAKTARILAASLLRRGQVDSALKLYNIVLPIERRNRNISYLNNTLNSLGIAYSWKAKYDVALKFHFESLNLREQTRDTAGFVVSLNNIGFVYYKLKDHDKALYYWLRCLDLKNKIGDDYDRDFLLINIGSAYAFKEDLIQAKKFVNLGMQNRKEGALTLASFILGVISLKAYDLDAAENYFLKSYNLAYKQGDIRLQFDNIDYLSQIYIQQGRVEKAIYFLDDGEDLIDRGNPYNLEAIKIYKQFFIAYSMKRDFAKVNAYQKKYIELRDNVYNEELTLNLMRTEAEFQERENLARIVSQKEILALKEKVIARQAQLNFFIGILMVGLVLLAGILVWSNRQKQKIRNILDARVKERTDALERSYNALTLDRSERKALLRHTSADIKNSLSTITGLCGLGLKDISDTKSLLYVSKINKISNELILCAKKFQKMSSQDK